MPIQKHAITTVCFRAVTLVLLISFLFPTGFAFAQGPVGSRSTSAIQSGLTPLSDTSLSKTNAGPTGVSGNLIQDGGFESYSAQTQDDPFWTESDSYFGTPLCNGDDCGFWLESLPHSGYAWAWFGGAELPIHTASISQAVSLPTCSNATLSFYFWIGYTQAGSGIDDVFTAKIDGVTVFSANATQKSSYQNYTLVSLNVTSFANGATHTVEFSHTNTGQDVIFNLDDISLVVTCPIISGSVGTGGATLSYTDGTAKAITSEADGSYSILVSNNWSGTVTPTHPCYTFSPTNRPYSNVNADQFGQNYAPTFTPTPACAVTTGVFRPSNGLLYLKNSNVSGFADVALNYGLPGDYPVVGDWDGNGTVTIGIYRQGAFYLRNSNTIGFADIVVAFGLPGDQPIAGDWDGDGVDTIGVFRPSNGQFLLRNSNSEGFAEMSFFLGNPGDVGIAGDWDGDGLDTTGVFRPSNGIIFMKNSNTTGFADIALNYGLPGDQPVTGDWNGDGVDTIGIYRNGTFYLRNSNTIGFAELIFALGNPGDMPIAGNWDALP
jgi:hypothetical protein